MLLFQKEEPEPLELQETESNETKSESEFDVFRCKQCPQLFTNQTKLDFHLTFAHPLKCDKCDFSASTKRLLECHYKRIHYTMKDLQCNICKFYTSSFDALRSHTRVVHNTDKIYKCNTCSKEFRFKNSLSYHEKYVHTNAKPFVCQKCDKKYKTKMDLNSHFKRVHASGKCQFHCKICPKSFPTFMELDFHENKIHPKPKLPKVLIKQTIVSPVKTVETFVQKIKSVTIMETQSNQIINNKPIEKDEPKLIDKKYKCEKCDKQFDLKSELIQHETLISFKCEKCKKIYASNLKLQKHYKRNICTYKCVFCLSAFILEQDYKNHLNWHTKGKTPTEEKLQTIVSDEPIISFPCSKCNIKFNQSVTLSKHMAAVHKEYPYVCQDCKHTFELEFVFFEHLKTHSPVNIKIKCDKCSRTFKTQLNLNKHIEINLSREQCRTW
jgi:KRAB domain-containing zinc finger protein